MSDTKNEATISVALPNEFSIMRLTDMLCGAFEQSIGYWATNARHFLPEGFDMKTWREENGFTERWNDDSGYQVTDFYLAPFVGGEIRFDEIVDERSGETTPRILDLAAIQKGLVIMAVGKFVNRVWGCGCKHFSDFVNEDDDSITHDVFVQCCVLGDIVYG